MTAVPEPLRSANVPDDLHQRVLAPYLPNARYVHRATLVQPGNGTSPRLAQPSSWLRIEGECGFEEPCYIAATGHLNAVECNITYNQLLYLGLAAIVRARLLPELRHWTLEHFFRAQLPDVLIGDYHAHFRKPMGSRRYHGALAFTDVRPRPERQLLLLQTHADFHDPAGGECAVDATIALVHWQPA